MPSQPILRNLQFTFEHDSTEDVLHILLDECRNNSGFITWVSLVDQPDVFLRVDEWDCRCLGISLKPASPRLGTKAPDDDAMRRLADELVAQYGQMEAAEISRHQYKASHTLDGDPRVTWSYEPFSESLYIDLEQDVEEKDDVEVEGYPHLYLRRAHDDDRIVGLFMIHVAHYLGTDMPTDGQLRALASELIEKYAPDA